MPMINGVNRSIVGTLSLNTTVNSDLSQSGEADLYAVTLTAGRSYTFTMNGNAANSVSGYGVSDTYIYLYDSNGNWVGSDDDSGVGMNSMLTITPTATGTYYLDARSFGNYGSGGYDLTVETENSAPELTGAQAALASQTGAGGTFTLTRAQLLQGYTDPDGNSLSIAGTPTVTANGTPLAFVATTTDGWQYRLPTIANTASAQTASISYSVSDGSDSVAASQSFLINPQSAPNAINMVAVGGNNHTSEDGGTVTYTVSLTNALTEGSLSVVLETQDRTEGRFLVNGQLADSQTLTFATGGATSQTVVVKGIQDYDNDGAMSYGIRAQAQDGATPAQSSSGAWTTAIRNFDGGGTTGYHNEALINDPDMVSMRLPDENGAMTERNVDRDMSVYLIGDDGRPREDVLVGNDGADRLYGGYMIDVLRGGIGNDRLYGGYEDDQLHGGDGNDTLYGEMDDDYLNGGAGNDRLDGGQGADTLIGGAGSDVFYVTLDDDGNVEDVVTEVATDAGTDTVYIPFQVERYVAPVGVEVIRMNAGFGASAVTGNTSNNGIYGNAGDNALDGGAGNDTLDGGSGTDSLLGGLGNDSLAGGAGNDSLSGGDGNDRLNGGAGTDIIVDGAGRDFLTGGDGSDRFVFANYTYMFAARNAADIVQDFNVGDRIDLSSLDANVASAGDQAFTFLASGSQTFTQANESATVSGFTNAGGQIYYNQGYLYIDNDTDANAEFIIQLTFTGTKTAANLAATDFIL